ncbi:MAG TPA: diacylglycerol kinase, partial [Phenylobacterium sp.]|nr:diacylglycerol kinase [Phenylobacterium sp.]
GKTNALALDLGVPLGTSFEQMLGAAAADRTKRRTCLEVLRPGQALPERRGFLFGTGAFVRATELAQRNHGLGLFDNAAIGVTLAGATVRTLLGGPNDPWRCGEAVKLSTSSGGLEPMFVVMASTLKRFPLGLRPYGEPREGLKVLSAAAPPKRLLRALSVILRGRDAPWLEAAGYRRHDVEMFALDLPGAFVLDGEIFEGGDLSVRQGPELEFVIP